MTVIETIFQLLKVSILTDVNGLTWWEQLTEHDLIKYLP